MKPFLTLDGVGLIAALIVGAWLLFFGLQLWWFFFSLMLAFLVLAAIATRMGEKLKKQIKTYEKSRTWKNVAANAVIPMLAVLGYYLCVNFATYGANLFVVSYVASVAAVTSDKFASEIGVFDAKVRMLLTLRKVKRGTSGGVSGLGLTLALAGSLLISLSLFALGFPLYDVLACTVAGFAGNLVDSVFGYFENKKVGNKFTSNFFGSLSAWVIAVVLILY